MMKKPVIIICLLMNYLLVKAQYGVYSLGEFAETRINPAYVASNGFSEVSALYRDQQNLPDVQLTSAYLLAKYPFVRRRSVWSGVGLEMSADSEGLEGAFKTYSLAGTYALNIPINRLNHLSTGATLKYFWRNVDTGKLYTGTQYIDGIGFDPGLMSGEDFEQFSSENLDIGWGISWRSVDKRGDLVRQVGLSLYNLNLPKSEFVTDDRPGISLVSEFSQRVFLNKKWNVDLEANMLYQTSTLLYGAGGIARLKLRYLNYKLRGQQLGFRLRYLNNRGVLAGVVWDHPSFSVGANYELPVNTVIAHQGAFELGIKLRKGVRPKVKRNRRRKSHRTLPPRERNTRPPKADSIPAKDWSDSLTTVPIDPDVVGVIEAFDTVKVLVIHFEFEFGSVVPVFDYSIIDQIVNRLEKFPELDIDIVGHTDNVGSQRFNQRLSEERAYKVFELIQRKGIHESRMRYYGRGESEPLVENTNEQNRSKNRRVEILFNIDE